MILIRHSNYQLWDRAHPGDKKLMTFYINDKFKYWIGRKEFDDLIYNFSYAFWDGTIAESDPAQIFVTS